MSRPRRPRPRPPSPTFESVLRNPYPGLFPSSIPEHSTFGSVRRQLPEELHVKIFALLGWKDIVRCSRVCTYFSTTIKASVALQYKIELELDGFSGAAESAPSSDSTGEQLCALLDRRHRWQTLSWQPCVLRVTYPPLHWSDALTRGTLVSATLAEGGKERTLRLMPLHALTATQTLALSTDDPLVLATALDPAQDLLALATCRLYTGRRATVHVRLRQLSSPGAREPHPAAAHAALDTALVGTPDALVLRVCGDAVAVIWTDQTHTTALAAWRWTTGAPLPIPGGELRFLADDMAFLDPRRLLLSSGRANAVYVVPLLGPAPPPAHALQRLAPDRILCFQLPHVQPRRRMLSIDIAVSADRDAPGTGALVLTLSARGGAEVRAACLVVRPRFFQSWELKWLLEDTPGCETQPPWRNAPLETQLSWDDWGPAHTRMFVTIAEVWPRCVGGERVVRTVDLDGSALPSTQVLDFNILTYDRPSPFFKPPPRNSVARSVKEPSTILETTLFFTAPVTTRAPYFTCTVPNEQDYGEFMIDDRRLLGVKRNEIWVDSVDVFSF